jgi:DNA-binding IclR family transcriptional regulator
LINSDADDDDMVDENTSKTLKTTANSLEIVGLVDEMDGARVSELADRLDAPKSTIHGHLATLRSEEFLIKRGDEYDLGPELLYLGTQVRTRREAYDLALEFTNELFRETRQDATFVVEMGGRAAFVHAATDNTVELDYKRVGDRRYLHNTAFGKAILAEFDRNRVERVLDKWGMPAETANTVTERGALFDELDTIREQGYAVNRGENMEGLYTIGAAATDAAGSVVGGFSVSGTEHAVLGDGRERELADAVLEIVDEYELELSISQSIP